jgi:hypothetical protein
LYAFVRDAFADRPHVHVLRQFTSQAVSQFPDGHFDMIYIDACHLYEAVSRDLEEWYPKVRSGGLFSGHDYWEVNVPFIGVRRAVDGFCGRRKLKLDYISLGHCGSWALRKP